MHIYLAYARFQSHWRTGQIQTITNFVGTISIHFLRVVQGESGGGGGGAESLVRFTNGKNRGSQVTDIKIRFSESQK